MTLRYTSSKVGIHSLVRYSRLDKVKRNIYKVDIEPNLLRNKMILYLLRYSEFQTDPLLETLT